MKGRHPLAGAAILCVAALGVAAPSSASAQSPPWKLRPPIVGLEYGGHVWTTLASDLKRNDRYEDTFEWRSGIDFRLRHKFADDARIALGASFRYELRHGDRLEADPWLDLGESWLQFRKGVLTFRAGNLLLDWGRNTLLSPLDLLNPVDWTRSLSSGGAEDSRIPLLATRLSLNLPPATVELVWIPFFKPMRVAFWGRDFAVFRPGLLEEMIPALVPGTGMGLVDDELLRASRRLVGMLEDMDPYQRDGLQSYLLADPPEELPWNSDLGARFGLSGSGVDFDVVGLWHVLDQPELSIHEALREPLLERRLPDSAELTQLTNPHSEILKVQHLRALTGGVDFAVAHAGFVVSGEAAVHSTAVRYDKRLEPYRTPLLQYALAVRYTVGSTFAVDVEFAHDIQLRPQPDAWIQGPHELRLAAIARLSVLRERLDILASASWNLLRRELYLHPRLTVEVDEHVTASFGAQIFTGFRPDVGASLDSFLAYDGGMIGYFRRNDMVYATVDFAY